MVRNLSAMQETQRVTEDPGFRRSPGGLNGSQLQCFCLENPWTEKPGGLQSIESQRVGHD